MWVPQVQLIHGLQRTKENSDLSASYPIFPQGSSSAGRKYRWELIPSNCVYAALQSVLLATIALRATMSFRMVAMMATFAGFPLSRRRW